MERHRTDLLALFVGLVFAGTALIALTGAVRLELADLLWLGPVLTVALGAVLVASVGRSAGREDPAATRGESGGPVAEPGTHGGDEGQ